MPAMKGLWNRNSFRSLIARRLIVAFVVFSSLITIVTTALQLLSDYRQGLHNIENDFKLIETSYLESLANSLWTFDANQIELQLTGIMNLPDMEYVEIRVDGRAQWSAGSRSHDNVVSSEVPIRFSDRGEELTIGVLEAVASLSSLYRRLWDKTLIILASNGIKTFLVVGFVFLIFDRLVTQRVGRLAHWVGRLSLDKPVQSPGLPPVPRKAGKPDEFDELEALSAAILGMHKKQVRFHRSLQEHKEQLTQLLDSMGEAVYRVDLEGKCTYCNPACLHILGFASAEELLGKNLHYTIHHSRLDGSPFPLEECAIYQAHIKGEHIHVDQEVFWRCDGTAFPVEYRVYPIVTEGKIAGSAVTFSDITDRTRVQEEIRQLNETLEQRIDERTAELRAAQGALIKQERLAALGQLTGTVAHEIRNPLGALATSLHVIKTKCAAAGVDLETAVTRSDRSIQRCQRIITDLLDFTRVKGVQRASLALDPWLAELLAEQDIAEGIALKTDLRTDGATISFDPEAFRRAVINLVDNACQAILEGTGRTGATAGELTVATRMNGAWVEVEVSDTGPGIPEDVLPHVLEPLFSTKSFGTGLGLPTVQRILEEHGGELDISSEEGRGTHSVLRLPLGGEGEEAQEK